MNSKTLFICLAILAVLSCSVQGLMMNNHKSFSHKVSVFAHEALQKVANLHMLSSEPEIPADILKDLEKFLKQNPDVARDFKKEKFSKTSAQKIQNFLLNNQNISNELVQLLDEDKDLPQCLKNLNKGQKQKLLKIAFQSIDFEKLLNSQDMTPSKDDADKVKKAINDDKELGPSVLKCLNDNKVFPPAN